MSATSEGPLLPPGFSELERFVPFWAGATSTARWQARNSASIEEIRDFYEPMVRFGEQALVYLEQFPMNSLPPDAARLFCLVLALAQAAMAIEIHGSARAPGTPWPNSMRIEKGAQPFG